MKRYITVDGGTTNTRVSVVCDGKILYTEKMNIGAGAAKDNPELYKNSIKRGIDAVLCKCKLNTADVTQIIASGMITSEYGLCNLPHISAPVNLADLHDSMYSVKLADISEIPFTFIRGVRNDSTHLSDCDIMRGEETELFGIAKSEYGKCTYVLPGSHSKLINTDEKGSITSFSTMLSGEMLYALSNATILKDAVDLSLSEFDEEYLFKGYAMALDEGINKALFKTRILKNVFKCGAVQCYSYLLGAVLCDEIQAIVKADGNHVVLAGKKQLKQAMAVLLKANCTKKLTVLSDEEVDASTSIGAVRIYENLV